MTLDASVYCDCFVRGRLRTPPPQPDLVYVEPSGSVETKAPEIGDQLKFDEWRHTACEHEDQLLLSHFLSNISLVALLRDELSYYAEAFPILLEKVVYNGTHCCDFLSLEDVSRLEGELDFLSSLPRQDREEDEFLQDFHRKMSELVRASLRIRNPIVF